MFLIKKDEGLAYLVDALDKPTIEIESDQPFFKVMSSQSVKVITYKIESR